jgi:hypothetical protein
MGVRAVRPSMDLSTSTYQPPSFEVDHRAAWDLRRRRCPRARALPHYKWRAGVFKRVAETGPRLANVVGKGRLSLTDFFPKLKNNFEAAFSRVKV